MAKILIPTDFSDASTNAFQYAVETFGAEQEFLLYHAYNEPHGAGTSMISITEILHENAIQDMEQQLTALKPRLASNGTIQCEIEHGDPVDSIVKFARLHRVDVIVMGTTGASGFKEYFMGSNAAAVLYNAECPVITVPETFQRHRAKQWTIAAEMNQLEQLQLPTVLMDVISRHQTSLKAVTVESNGGGDTLQAVKSKVRLKNQTGTDLQIDIDTVVHANKAKAIEIFADTANADGVIILPGRHSKLNRFFNPSLSKELSQHLSLPVIAIRD